MGRSLLPVLGEEGEVVVDVLAEERLVLILDLLHLKAAEYTLVDCRELVKLVFLQSALVLLEV